MRRGGNLSESRPVINYAGSVYENVFRKKRKKEPTQVYFKTHRRLYSTPTMSTKGIKTAASSGKGVFPVAEVYREDDGGVVVEWGGVPIEISQPDRTLYSERPYFFYAVDAASPPREPPYPTFTALLKLDGGTLTIKQTRYRIQVRHQGKKDDNEKRRYTIQKRAQDAGCANMGSADLLDLKECRPEPNCHHEPDSELQFIPRPRELKELHAILDPVVATNRDDKQCKVVLEYATISGAGKTRWAFRSFLDWTWTPSQMPTGSSPLKARTIHMNFNGADGSSDILSISRDSVSPAEAVCRLLLGRGLFECNPSMKWVTPNLEFLPDSMLPPTKAVVDAIFKDRFGDGGGLLVVHLDELSMLLRARKRIEKWKRKAGTDQHAAIEKDQDECDAEHAGDWIKNLIERFASFTEPARRRFLVVVITHTSPSGRIMGEKTLSKVNYNALNLYPFTLAQSRALLNAERKRNGIEPLSDKQWTGWKACVALAGGHPCLLMDCYRIITAQQTAGAQTATVSHIAVNLMTDKRVTKVKSMSITPEEAKFFVTDVLAKNLVKEEKHARILDAGVAWYAPKLDTENEGFVSAPFPYLLLLMEKAARMYGVVAHQLNPCQKDYEPTKAMEFIAALGVLLQIVGHTEDWVNGIETIPKRDMAIRSIRDHPKPFMSVWPCANEKATDFGGKVNFTGDEPFEAIIGQVKMQKDGHETTQNHGEVMKLAWFIGKHVASGDLTMPVHAVFVSSRRSQKNTNMKSLDYAFRVAMTGCLTEEDAIKETKAELSDKKVDIRHVIQHLNTKEIEGDRYKFTYVGRPVDCTDQVTRGMTELLPSGIFSSWYCEDLRGGAEGEDGG